MFSKNRSRKDGYHDQCKDCVKAYKETNKEKLAEYFKAYYEANKEKYAAYREANKEKYVEYHKAYREDNKEKIAKRDKAYYEANKDKRTEQSRAYYEANKEKKAEYQKAYREDNKDKYAEWDSRKRARKRNAIPKFLRNCEIEKQRLRDIYKLRDIFSVVTNIEHHVDHMWPLSDGGPHWSGNLQIITAKENLSKHASVCRVTKKNIRDSLRIARKEYEDSSNGHRDR